MNLIVFSYYLYLFLTIIFVFIVVFVYGLQKNPILLNRSCAPLGPPTNTFQIILQQRPLQSKLRTITCPDYIHGSKIYSRKVSLLKINLIQPYEIIKAMTAAHGYITFKHSKLYLSNI
jgi:hypothetical protein